MNFEPYERLVMDSIPTELTDNARVQTFLMVRQTALLMAIYDQLWRSNQPIDVPKVRYTERTNASGR